MAQNADGTGDVVFRVTSTTIIPAHTEYVPPVPGEVPPPPVEVPEMASATLTPMEDPTSLVTVTGGFTIVTPQIDAFTVGDTFTLKIEKKPPPIAKAAK